jgi:hypothetical protein
MNGGTMRLTDAAPRGRIASAGLVFSLACCCSTRADITITYPNAPGITWGAGEQVTVTWMWSDLAAHHLVSVLIRAGGDGSGAWLGGLGIEFQPLFAVGGGQATFFVPDWLEDGEDYVVELWVLSTYSILASDRGDFPIAITGAKNPMRLDLTSPDGKSSWAAGTSQAIAWSAGDMVGRVSFSVLDGNTSTARPNPAATFTLDGSLTWDIPENIGDGADYAVVALAWPGLGSLGYASWLFFDVSPAFAIHGSLPRPTLALTTPNGGEIIAAGSPIEVCWTSSATTGTVQLNLLRDGVYEEPAATTAPTEVGEGCASWRPCETFIGNDFRVRATLSLPSGLFVRDESDEVFTILPIEPAPSIEVVWPNGGEILPAGSTQMLMWTTENTADETIMVHVIRESGQGFSIRPLQSVPCGPSGHECQTLDWPVCPGRGDDLAYRIQVCLMQRGCFWTCDASDGPFEITPFESPPTLELTSPVGGEVWTAGSTRTVTWIAGGADGMDVEVRLAQIGADSGGLYGAVPAEAGRFELGISPFQQTSNDFTILLQIRENGCVLAADRSGPFTITTINCTCGDINSDTNLDLTDYALFAGCMGDVLSTSPECICSDLNGDQSIDLRDFAIFANLLGSASGNQPPDCP